MSYVFYNTDVEENSYGRFFPQLGIWLLDLVSPNYFWDRLKTVKAVGEIELKDDFRIDLVSWEQYGSKAYWWVILLYNGLQVEDLVKGTRLLIPDLSEIEYLFSDVKLKSRML